MRTTTMRSCLLTALAALAASPALAQEITAREHFARGTTAFQQGDNDAAITEWNAAYAEDPRPLIQYNLSQAFERAGRLPEAITALDTYLQHAEANDPNQPDARARIVSLRERISHTSVRIVGGPENATILIDDEDKGRTPRPDRMAGTTDRQRQARPPMGARDARRTRPCRRPTPSRRGRATLDPPCRTPLVSTGRSRDAALDSASGRTDRTRLFRDASGWRACTCGQ